MNASRMNLCVWPCINVHLEWINVSRIIMGVQMYE